MQTMTVTMPKKGNAIPRPSNTLLSCARAVLNARALAEVTREKIDAISAELLDIFNIHADAKWGERVTEPGILTPKNAYLMSDEDASIYYPEREKAIRKAGFTSHKVGYCPALIAEDLQRQAERLFMEASVELTAKAGLTPEMIEKIISCGLPNGLERRKEYLELNLRYVVPFLEVK